MAWGQKVSLEQLVNATSLKMRSMSFRKKKIQDFAITVDSHVC